MNYIKRCFLYWGIVTLTYMLFFILTDFFGDLFFEYSLFRHLGEMKVVVFIALSVGVIDFIVGQKFKV